VIKLRGNQRCLALAESFSQQIEAVTERKNSQQQAYLALVEFSSHPYGTAVTIITPQKSRYSAPVGFFFDGYLRPRRKGFFSENREI
jgi:hypothetical protein